MQELRPLNWTSYERPLIQVTSNDCFQFILFLISEAITRGNQDETDANQSTVIFEDNAIVTPYLIMHINITLATDLDTIITTGLSFNKKMVEFAQKKPDLQILDELKNIMIGYIFLQNFLRENLGR